MSNIVNFGGNTGSLIGSAQATEINTTYISPSSSLQTSHVGNLYVITGNLEIIAEVPASTGIIHLPKPSLSVVGSPLVAYNGENIRNLFCGANEQYFRPLNLSIPKGWYYLNIACILKD